MKIKNTYLLFVTIFGLISLAMYTTYAMFTASIDIGGFVDLTASNLPTDTSVIEYERLTLSAGETKIIDLNITNSTTSSLYYGVWYEMIEPTSITEDITIAKLDTSVSETIGELATSTSSVVTLILKNETEDSITVNIGVGYSETSSLNLPTDRQIITNVASNSVLANEKIISLSQGTTWESGASGLYEINLTLPDGTVTTDYRYIGAGVDNYVKFNNDMYQIIGVFDENTHGIEGEQLVKLISVNMLNPSAWGIVKSATSGGSYSTYKNDWTGTNNITPANGNIILNEYFYNKTSTSNTYGSCKDWTYYYNSDDYKTSNCTTLVGYGIDSNFRNYIETTTWHLYGYTTWGLSASDWYLCERGLYDGCTSGNSGGYDETTTAKIGLIYPSDYTYASGYFSSSSIAVANSNYLANQNWLYKGYEWTITPISNTANKNIVIYAPSYLLSYNSDYGNGIRPTFYLKSSVEITKGDGTFENPFVIE